MAQLKDLTTEYLERVGKEWLKIKTNGEYQFELLKVFVDMDVAAYRNTSESEGEESKPAPIALKHIIREHSILSLLGAPGAGKSTTLQFIGLCFTNKQAAQRLELNEFRVPIKLNSVYLSQLNGHNLRALVIEEIGSILSDVRPELIEKLFSYWMEEGFLLVLLDGLDEFSSSLSGNTNLKIQRFAKTVQDKNNRLIITSRLTGYISLGEPFIEYVLQPLTDLSTIQKFLYKWMSVLRPEWGDQAVNSGVDELIADMQRNPSLTRLLDNPLILSMAADVFVNQNKRNFVQTRVELYDRYRADLWKRAQIRGFDITPDVKEKAEKLLEFVAWGLHIEAVDNIRKESTLSSWLKSENIKDISSNQIDELLQVIQKGSGLLKLSSIKPGEPKEYLFAHWSWQEYYVAKKLQRYWEKFPDQTWNFIKPRLHLSEWQEPLLLFAGLLSEDDFSDLIRKVIKTKSNFESYLGRDAVLTINMMAERLGENGSTTEEFIMDMINTRFEGSFISIRCRYRPGARSRIINAYSSWGKVAIPLLIKLAVSEKDTDIQSDAIKALSEIGKFELKPLVDFYEDDDWKKRKVVIESLGHIGSDDSLSALRIALREDENPHVRLAAAGSIKIIGKSSYTILPTLIEALDDEDRFVRRIVTFTLGQIGYQATAAIPALITAMLDSSDKSDEVVRKNAAEALGYIADKRDFETIGALIKALRDESRNVRKKAIIALKQIGSNTDDVLNALTRVSMEESHPEVRILAIETLSEMGAIATQALIQALNDGDWEIRVRAADALKSLGTNAVEAVPYLIELLNDENFSVIQAAESALINIGSPAIPALIATIKTNNPITNKYAVHTLGKIGPKASNAIPILNEKYFDANIEWELRQIIIEALGRIGIATEDSIPVLIDSLGDENVHIRQAAKVTLRDTTVSVLKELLKNDELPVRKATAEALKYKGIDDSSAVLVLIGVLNDENMYIRRTAADSLRYLGNDSRETVPTLAQVILENKDNYVREKAAEALGKIGEGNNLVISALIEAVYDPDDDVCKKAVEALGNLGADDEKIIQAIRDLLERRVNFRIRVTAVRTLGQLTLGSQLVIPVLISALDDNDPIVASTAADILGELGTKALDSVQALIEKLNDEDQDLRESAAEALRKIKPNDGEVDVAIKSSASSSKKTKDKTAKVTEQVTPKTSDDDQPISELKQTINNRGTSSEERIIAIRKLESYDQSAIPILLKLFRDKDRHAQKASVRTLIELLHRLSDENQEIEGRQWQKIQKRIKLILPDFYEDGYDLLELTERNLLEYHQQHVARVQLIKKSVKTVVEKTSIFLLISFLAGVIWVLLQIINIILPNEFYENLLKPIYGYVSEYPIVTVIVLFVISTILELIVLRFK